MNFWAKTACLCCWASLALVVAASAWGQSRATPPCVDRGDVPRILQASQLHLEALAKVRFDSLEWEQRLTPAESLREILAAIAALEQNFPTIAGHRDLLLRLERCGQVERGFAVRFFTTARERLRELEESRARSEALVRGWP